MHKHEHEYYASRARPPLFRSRNNHSDPLVRRSSSTPLHESPKDKFARVWALTTPPPHEIHLILLPLFHFPSMEMLNTISSVESLRP